MATATRREGPREKLAQAAYLYWIGHLAPLSLSKEGDEHLELFQFTIELQFEDLDDDHDLDEEVIFNPKENSDLLLIQALAACDGYLPSGLERTRAPSDRISSAALARLLDVEQRDLAVSFRDLKVQPKTIRFDHGPLKGYARDELEAAWDREWGTYYEKREKALKKRGW